MRKTFKYRAKINKETEANAFKWLELCRILYNLMLERRIKQYKGNGKSISYFTQCNSLPQLKKDRPEFKIINAQTLQDVLERLDKAFKAFFRRVKDKSGKAGFPRFKGKGRYSSFTLKQAGYKLEGHYLYITNIGRFKLFLSRPIEGDIKTITVKLTSTGKWFVLFSCDNASEKKGKLSLRKVGIDVGVSAFLTDSNGKKVENPKFFRKSEKQLRRRQRSLSRKKKGSKRRFKARLLVAKAHEKITNQRLDFLHKTANEYIKHYRLICIEDLNIKGMVLNHHLSKSIADASWSKFFELLSYKAEEAGRKLIKVPPKNTSQICSRCGEIVKKSLSVRVHNCPYCGLKIDRDHNAAINILKVGQTFQTLSSH